MRRGRRIVFTPTARDEVDELAAYIAAENLDAALQFYEAVDKACRLLLDMLLIGTPRNFRFKQFKSARVWPITEFPERLIFYRPTAEGILVLHVIHSAIDYRRILGPEN